MDSRTPLDHVLFQLTPTRTRCDLVIYGGGVSEKLASGLLQPFLSHLKTAQQQISKGGYSISLTPPPNASYWFSKATLQRFVRFVSTPEVLERFVTIEKELEQIESSVQSNDIADAQGGNGSHQRFSSSYVQDDNPKARLQRALETRKAVLWKEQAMAYARALVTGFELDSINDLISFSDAFGASRLREACLNFMELCKKKNQDRMWMDEIAAMQASRLELPFHGTSGIVLASEENYGNNGRISGSIDASESSHGSVDLNQDSGSGHMSIPWSNHHPQYMNNFQGPMYSQMPPYQGYMYPGVPYFPNAHWPPQGDDWVPKDRKKHKSSSRKNKSSHGKGHESSESSDSTSETQSDDNSQNGATESAESARGKNRKKSSRKVIIRNINYITSDKDGEREVLSDGDESTSHGHKKSHLSTANDSNEERTKGNEPWGAFQSILLQEKDLDAFESEQRSSAVNLQPEEKTYQKVISSDSFLAVKREANTQEEFHYGSFGAGDNLRPVRRTKTDSTFDESLLSQRNEGSANLPRATFSDHPAESLMIKRQNEGDWFTSKDQDNLVNNRSLYGDYDPSLAGGHESRKSLPVDDSFFIQNPSFGEDGSEPTLRREVSMDADIVEATRSENGNKSKSNDKSEANTAHEPEDLCMVLGRDSATENAIPSWTRDMDYENNPSSTEPDPASTIKPEDAKKGPVRKSPGKETKPKNSDGTLGRSKTELTSRNKKPMPAGKSSTPRNKNKEEETRKRLEELAIQRQKRIAERSAAAASKRLPVKKTPTAKTEDPKIQPVSQQNKKTVFRSSTIERLATARVTPKPESVQSKATQPKKAAPKANSSPQKSNVTDQKRVNWKTEKPDATQKKESKATQKPLAEPNSIDEFQAIKELHSIDLIEKKEVNNVPQRETKEESSNHNDSTKVEISTEAVREIRVRSENVTWAEKCEIIQIATPPAQEEIIAEAVHTRKKWNTEETSPKAVKGFRRLLMFGRKSRSSAVSMA